jgi:hypothetical protein
VKIEMRDIHLMVSPLIGYLLIVPLLDSIIAKRTGELKIPWGFGQQHRLKRIDDPLRFDRNVNFLLWFPLAFIFVLVTVILLL